MLHMGTTFQCAMLTQHMPMWPLNPTKCVQKCGKPLFFLFMVRQAVFQQGICI